jgi:hypothetical protein
MGFPRLHGVLMEANPNFTEGWTEVALFIVNDAFAGGSPG